MARKVSEFQKKKSYRDRLRKLLVKIDAVTRKRQELLNKAYQRRGKYRDVRDKAIRAGRPHSYADHVIEVQNRRITYYSSGITQAQADRSEVLKEIKKVETEIPKEKWREVRRFAYTFNYLSTNRSNRRSVEVAIYMDAPEGTPLNYYKARVFEDMSAYFVGEFFNPAFISDSDQRDGMAGNLGPAMERYPSEDNTIKAKVEYNDLKYPSNSRESDWFVIDGMNDARKKAEDLGQEWN